MLIAIDPGATTGVAFGTNVRDRDFELLSTKLVLWEQRLEYFSTTLRDNAAVIAAIIIERFALSSSPLLQRSQAGSEFPSVRVIGIIEAYAHLYGLHSKIVYQVPVNMASIRTIPAHHLKLVGASPHTQDAYKHLRYYVLTRRGG